MAVTNGRTRYATGAAEMLFLIVASLSRNPVGKSAKFVGDIFGSHVQGQWNSGSKSTEKERHLACTPTVLQCGCCLENHVGLKILFQAHQSYLHPDHCDGLI